jgi:hypothetical protein
VYVARKGTHRWRFRCSLARLISSRLVLLRLHTSLLRVSRHLRHARVALDGSTGGGSTGGIKFAPQRGRGLIPSVYSSPEERQRGWRVVRDLLRAYQRRAQETLPTLKALVATANVSSLKYFGSMLKSRFMLMQRDPVYKAALKSINSRSLPSWIQASSARTDEEMRSAILFGTTVGGGSGTSVGVGVGGQGVLQKEFQASLMGLFDLFYLLFVDEQTMAEATHIDSLVMTLWMDQCLLYILSPLMLTQTQALRYLEDFQGSSASGSKAPGAGSSSSSSNNGAGSTGGHKGATAFSSKATPMKKAAPLSNNPYSGGAGSTTGSSTGGSTGDVAWSSASASASPIEFAHRQAKQHPAMWAHPVQEEKYDGGDDDGLDMNDDESILERLACEQRQQRFQSAMSSAAGPSSLPASQAPHVVEERMFTSAHAQQQQHLEQQQAAYLAYQAAQRHQAAQRLAVTERQALAEQREQQHLEREQQQHQQAVATASDQFLTHLQHVDAPTREEVRVHQRALSKQHFQVDVTRCGDCGFRGCEGGDACDAPGGMDFTDGDILDGEEWARESSDEDALPYFYTLAKFYAQPTEKQLRVVAAWNAQQAQAQAQAQVQQQQQRQAHAQAQYLAQQDAEREARQDEEDREEDCEEDAGQGRGVLASLASQASNIFQAASTVARAVVTRPAGPSAGASSGSSGAAGASSSSSGAAGAAGASSGASGPAASGSSGPAASGGAAGAAGASSGSDASSAAPAGETLYQRVNRMASQVASFPLKHYESEADHRTGKCRAVTGAGTVCKKAVVARKGGLCTLHFNSLENKFNGL